MRQNQHHPSHFEWVFREEERIFARFKYAYRVASKKLPLETCYRFCLLKFLSCKFWKSEIRKSEISKISDFRTFQILLKISFWNIVRKLLSKSGNTKLLKCQYHSWSYDLDGSLVRVPDERDFFNLDLSCKGLKEVYCDVWDGWVYISLSDDDPGHLRDFLDPVASEMECFKSSEKSSLSWPFNFGNKVFWICWERSKK